MQVSGNSNTPNRLICGKDPWCRNGQRGCGIPHSQWTLFGEEKYVITWGEINPNILDRSFVRMLAALYWPLTLLKKLLHIPKHSVLITITYSVIIYKRKGKNEVG